MKKSTTPTKKQKGFTLIELMVAMSLGLILLLSGVAMYSQLKFKINAAQTTKSLHQRARLTLNVLTRVTAMVGNNYCQDRGTIVGFPIKYDSLERMDLLTTIPLGEGFNYAQHRTRGDSHIGATSTCGQSTITYNLANYRIGYYAGTYRFITISNFTPALNVKAQDLHVLAQNVKAFTVEFGMADTPQDYYATKYISPPFTVTDPVSNVRSIKYTLTLESPDGKQEITLSRVVMLENPWVLE